MLSEFYIGVKNFLRAPRFIFKHNLAWVLLVPIVLNIILVVLGFGATGRLSEMLTEFVQTSFGDALFSGDSYIGSAIEWVFWLLFKLAFLFVYAYVGGFIVLMILSPLLAYISERTEEIEDGTTYPFSWSQFFQDILRGIGVAGRSLFYELLVSFIVLLITFIPGLNLVTPILFFAVTAYFYGYSFMDYNLERRRLSSKSSQTYIFNHKAMTIGVGSPYALLVLLPVIGPSFAGIAAIFGTVAATLTWKEVEKA